MAIKIINIMGQSGTGKSSLKKAIKNIRPEVHEVITCTTRGMREGEKDGVDYHFLDEATMAQKIFVGEMLECVVFNDWVYGTSIEALDKDKINIGVWNPEGAEILNQDNRVKCINILLETNPKLRLMRSLEREENPNVDEIIRRYKADQKDFSHIDFDYFILENNGEKTIEELANMALSIVDKFGQANL